MRAEHFPNSQAEFLTLGSLKLARRKTPWEEALLHQKIQWIEPSTNY